MIWCTSDVHNSCPHGGHEAKCHAVVQRKILLVNFDIPLAREALRLLEIWIKLSACQVDLVQRKGILYITVDTKTWGQRELNFYTPPVFWNPIEHWYSGKVRYFAHNVSEYQATMHFQPMIQEWKGNITWWTPKLCTKKKFMRGKQKQLVCFFPHKMVNGQV